MNCIVTDYCRKHDKRCHFLVQERAQFLHSRADAIAWRDRMPREHRIVWDAGCTDDYGYAAMRGGIAIGHA